MMRIDGRVHPDCINASNPHHECVDYCYQKISAAAAAKATAKLEEERKKAPPAERTVHPDCVNASNPYHECVEDCFRTIVQAREQQQHLRSVITSPDLAEEERKKAPPAERMVHPDRVNAANPYHECVEDCIRNIVQAREQHLRSAMTSPDLDGGQLDGTPSSVDTFEENRSTLDDIKSGRSEQNDGDNDHNKTSLQTGQSDGDDRQQLQNDAEAGYPIMNERQKKLFELRLKMNEARKANQMAMVAEKKKLEAPPESRGISKQNWLENRKKKIGKLLDSNGLDMSKAYMLDTQDMAEAKYKKWEKEPAPSGWDVFNQKTLYNAYKKRTKNIHCDMEAYNIAKEADPEFYRDAASLQYGKVKKTPEENIDRMVKELEDTKNKRESFSRRRKFHEEKDIDSINDRNEHFNKKIERAFGKYTLEIKNNLERGTALPD